MRRPLLPKRIAILICKNLVHILKHIKVETIPSGKVFLYPSRVYSPRGSL
jgi:hypothetical protein